MPRTSKTKTVNVNDVRIVSQQIGDSLTDTYLEKNDLKAASAAIQAYGTAIKAAQCHLIYKKLTGSPARMEFFETK